jgi:hypothetical protein
MWHKNFPDRLQAWTQLRAQSVAVPKQQALSNINAWWFESPWQPYHLHWDDRPTWPDPWQLLGDNLYCSLARSLGIVYTIALLNREDLADVVLAEVDGDNLVLVDQKKYILNWDQSQIVNINLGQVSTRRSLGVEQIKNQIK